MSQIMNRNPHEIVGTADFAGVQVRVYDTNKYTENLSVSGY